MEQNKHLERRVETVVRSVVKGLAILVLIALIMLLVGYIFMQLWNWSWRSSSLVSGQAAQGKRAPEKRAPVHGRDHEAAVLQVIRWTHGNIMTPFGKRKEKRHLKRT